LQDWSQEKTDLKDPATTGGDSTLLDEINELAARPLQQQQLNWST